MPRLFIRASALAVAFAGTLSASETVTRSQVLDAIHTFEVNASGSLTTSTPDEDKNDAVAKASNTILKYSLSSDDVVVDLGTASVPWCDVKKGLAELSHSGDRGLLLAAYLSGSVKAQLQSGKQDANPYPGWLAMLRIYRSIRIREGVKIPEVESLLERQMNGTLESYAAEAMQRSTEALQKTYGSPSDGPKQVITASARP